MSIFIAAISTKILKALEKLINKLTKIILIEVSRKRTITKSASKHVITFTVNLNLVMHPGEVIHRMCFLKLQFVDGRMAFHNYMNEKIVLKYTLQVKPLDTYSLDTASNTLYKLK